YLKNRLINVNTFPMGIDYDKFQSALSSEGHKQEKIKLKQSLSYEKIILSIDRLDYTKGILNRLFAYELFLDNNPDWKNKIKLILQIIPSRIGVDKYGRLKKQIDELVGRINGKFGNIDWAPISYQYGFVEFEPLTALYSIADIMLVTPLRDGMNLISKEFLACKEDKTGVLILSEMAGSSKELGEAIIVNPNYKEEIAAAIETAINMPREVQIKKNTTMQQRLQRYNVVRWARDFISTMDEINNEQNNTGNIISDSFTKKMLTDYNTAEKRILFIDYDGTLIPYKYDPLTAVPEEKIINMLKRFTKKDNLDVVLVSGRDKKILDQWFGKLNIQIIAEHGAWIKTNKGWEMLKPLSAAWKPQIKAILEIYTDRLPGSFIEEKEFSLAWHYRKSEPELAKLRRRELTDQLLNLTANKELQVLKGHKVVEIRSVGINKGLAGLKILSENNYDFVAAIGDDWTDEDLFNILPLSAYTIMVGHSHSSAKCRIEDYTKVIELLNKIEEEKETRIQTY
ncbi:MAG: bifunctional alpha,alpha-trehalose-phosphate synthase (UDP-forming)/trehalose-phosphatase, partial [Syntrophothermus sp.]